jgi:uroporphyrin-III C-methyltransferase
VRLKGGSIYLWKRSEEIEFVELWNSYLWPGISSSIAVPTSQGISLTKRSFREFLGDYRNNFIKKLSTDVALAANHSDSCYSDGNEQTG